MHESPDLQAPPEPLSRGWRLLLAALIVVALVAAIRGADDLGVAGILATTITTIVATLSGTPSLDLTQLPGPVGRVASSLAQSGGPWPLLVGANSSRLPVTAIIVVAGVVAGLTVHALSVLMPTAVAVVLVVAGIHIAHRTVTAALGLAPRRRSAALVALDEELDRHEALAPLRDRLADPATQSGLMVAEALARGIGAAVGRSLLLAAMSLPLGWAVVALGASAAAVVIAPEIARQVAHRAAHDRTQA